MVSSHIRLSAVVLGLASIAVAVSGSASSALGQAGEFNYEEWFNQHNAEEDPFSIPAAPGFSSSSVDPLAEFYNDPAFQNDPFVQEYLQQLEQEQQHGAPALVHEDSSSSFNWDEWFTDTGSSSSAWSEAESSDWAFSAPIVEPVIPVVRSCNFSDLLGGTLEQTAALWLCERGIVTGVADGRMAPADTLNRAQAATMIVRALGLQPTVPSSFPDVAPTAWYASTVAAAQEHGIVTGYEDGTFKPDRPVGRAELAAMTVRAFNLTIDGAHGAAPVVPQDIQTGQWYEQPVETALAHQLFPGDPERFSPLKVANRSSAIIALYQAMQATGRE